MRIRLKLSVRMLFFITSITFVVFYATLSIITNRLKKDTYAETMKLNESKAKSYASTIENRINTYFQTIILQQRLYEVETELQNKDKRLLHNASLKWIVERDVSIVGVFDTWEMRFVDSNWDKEYGVVSTSVYRQIDGSLVVGVDSADLEGADPKSNFNTYKLTAESYIGNPSLLYNSSISSDSLLRTAIISPFEIENQFGGLLGMDLNLHKFSDFIDSVNTVNTYDIIFLSTDGVIIAHPNNNYVGKRIWDVDTLLTGQFDIIAKIKSEKSSSFTIKDAVGNDSVYSTLVSFRIGNTETPWAILISAPLQDVDKQFNNTTKVLRQAVTIGLVFFAILVLIFAFTIVMPIVKTRGIVSKLAVGDVHGIDKLKIKNRDELGEMAMSVNTVSDGLNEVTKFAENIGSGNYDYDFKQLSDNDSLGLSIIDMRDSLKQVKAEEEVRKEEARQLEWASAGMNIFNKILRVDNKSLENLTYDIIKILTTYLDSHMGGMYLKTDNNEKEFELVSFIGFSKEKYQKKYVSADSGIVGQCMLEKQTIFINDVHKDSSLVGSGLGFSVPRSILVVPLLSNRVLVGILEIESLNDIHQYHIEFVERIAETIASTVSTVKNNVRTASLLEKAQRQAEELEQQEEEMRQNMEEMQATQEEASKQEVELSSFIEGFNDLMPIIEYDTQGKVIDINDNYLKIYKSKKSQILGKYHKADLFMNEADRAKHNEFWSKLENGEEQESLEYIKSGRDDYWFTEIFVPVKDEYGLVQKVLCMGFDITEQKKAESQIKQIQDGANQEQKQETKSVSKINVVDLNKKYESIDLTYLKMVYKKDSGKIYNILKLYYDTLPSQIADIEDLVKSRDYVKLKSRISSLKTKMSYLGLKKVYARLGDMEKLLSTQKNLANIPDMIKEVIGLWLVAYKELQIILVISEFKK